MRLLIHQALKDVRLLRWLLRAWILVLAAFHGIVVYVLAAPAVNADLLQTLGTVETILGLAGTAAFIVLAAFLVQNDSPSATTTFWVTRPDGLLDLSGLFPAPATIPHYSEATCPNLQ